MSLTESEIIRMIQAEFMDLVPQNTIGIGDDCAILPALDPGCHQIISTDLLLEGVHFLADRISPRDLGYKAMAVNLSDLAAKGGTPQAAFLSLGLPEGVRRDWVCAFLRGMHELCKAVSLPLLGGDTTRSEGGIVINICVTGSLSAERPKLRSQARPGDRIAVTAALGDSAAGLRLLQSNRSTGTIHSKLIERHHRPTPFLREGQWLSTQPAVHAMMDLSDGLATDLPRILEASGCGAEIELTDLPLSQELREVATEEGWDPVDLAVAGGEDYCLLFTLDAHQAPELLERYLQSFNRPFYLIGGIVAERSLTFVHEGVRQGREFRGFEHFPRKN